MYKYATAIGIDVGRTGINYGIVRRDGAVLWRNRIRYSRQRNKTAVLRKLYDVVDDVQAYTSEHSINPLCIGVGSPGFVDIHSGIVRGAALLIRDWKDIPLARLVHDRSGLPVFVDNDATLYGYGEWMFGAARNVDDMIFIALRTGIGGAIVINRRLYRGKNNASGEFGQMTINFSGPRSKWGGKGCLESYASSQVLVDRYNRRVKKEGEEGKQVSSALPIFERFRAGETVAVELVKENARYVGIGLGNLVNVFAPGLIVVGGGMALAGEEYIRLIHEAVIANSMSVCHENLSLVAAELKHEAGFIGAGHFALSMLDGKMP